MGIRNPWVAFQFDNAIRVFGWYIENKLDERDKKGKPKWTLAQIMAGDAWQGGSNGNTLILLFLGSPEDDMVM